MTCDASPKCIDVSTHGSFGTVCVAVPDRCEDGLMLFLEAAVVVGRRE
jgi:hypothetical protein